MKNLRFITFLSGLVVVALAAVLFTGCGNQAASTTGGALGSDVASQVYVPPGEYDEFYAFMSGGFSGQIGAHGLP